MRKSDETGNVVKAKARLIARGFSQRPDVDLNEAFTPTPAAAFFRLMAAVARELLLDLYYFDVQRAFVQAELKEVVSTRLPKGCRAVFGKVVRLNRSPYCLQQRSRSWHKNLVTHLKSLGFEQNLADPWVFRLIRSVSVIAVVRVNDFYAVGRKERCDRFCKDLGNVVPIINLGERQCCTGCHYSRDKVAGLLVISQKCLTQKSSNLS